MTEWVRIRSWHLAVPSRLIDSIPTRCGRWAKGRMVSDIPLGEKTCETCLRLLAKDEERREQG